ncbi:hypothetical protein IDJ77_08865 [Mucilaginibacter sp. ZT4R22]|uniref:Uncharacterized protein n=1 Tax=Mucilaginibacter pankratovii TaxID=2772110 RepID=A0ABR7WRL4_9SPHI|nr:hypothetical protein [Mucilaginibacter pankratovii]MBD1363917.1 hypothetical protein [Mucilaginibacter pankratovii]
MKKILLAALCFLLAACGSGKNDNVAETIPDTTAVPKQIYATELVSRGPIAIDSSVYVIYPLPHDRAQNDDDSGSFLSSDGGRSITFWNIVFYNTATKKYHLLAENKKMIINSYNTSYSGSEYSSDSSAPVHYFPDTSQEGNYIFYSIIAEDVNKDGKIDSKDPTYLFSSDREGNNLKQISPRGTNVNNWEVVKKSGMVLINTQRDSTINNKSYEAPVISYAYDLKKANGPERVFSTEFNMATDKLYKGLWPVKKDK